MSILGSDGVEMFKKRLDESSAETITISTYMARWLVTYYQRLTAICDHEWDSSSPIDRLMICRNCGLLHKGAP